MSTISYHTESNFLLKPFNLKSLCMILILISSISIHKSVISSLEIGLTVSVGEIEPFKVLDEDVLFDLPDASYVTTLVYWLSWIVILCCCMCYDFFSSCTILCLDCPVMIALDPEMEVSSALNHLVIGSFVVIKLFQVSYVTADLCTTKWYNQID